MSIKLLKIQLEELKEAIILNDHAHDDDLEETYENLVMQMNYVYDILKVTLKKDSKK